MTVTKISDNDFLVITGPVGPSGAFPIGI
jgi:hypothetical protein